MSSWKRARRVGKTALVVVLKDESVMSSTRKVVTLVHSSTALLWWDRPGFSRQRLFLDVRGIYSPKMLVSKAAILLAASHLAWPDVDICVVTVRKLTRLDFLILTVAFMSLTGESLREAMLNQQEKVETRMYFDKITHRVFSKVRSWPHQIRNRGGQSLINRSLCDVITTERGHMDGMRRSVPLHWKGKPLLSF